MEAVDCMRKAARSSRQAQIGSVLIWSVGYSFVPTTTNTIKQYGSLGFVPRNPSQPDIEATVEVLMPWSFSAFVRPLAKSILRLSRVENTTTPDTALALVSGVMLVPWNQLAPGNDNFMPSRICRPIVSDSTVSGATAMMILCGLGNPEISDAMRCCCSGANTRGALNLASSNRASSACALAWAASAFASAIRALASCWIASCTLFPESQVSHVKYAINSAETRSRTIYAAEHFTIPISCCLDRGSSALRRYHSHHRVRNRRSHFRYGCNTCK